MFILTPLTRRPIALLWTGQVLSAVGDELYKVALIWLAVGLGGADAGYLGALEAAAGLVAGLLAGRWVDRLDPRHVMLGVDLLRGAMVALVPLAALAGPPGWWLLIPVAVVVSGTSALFDPALQALMPALAPEAALRQAANGLLEATRRLARILGPGLLAVVQAVLPPIHLFTLDAVSFWLSAATVAALGRPAAEKSTHPGPLRGTLALLRAQPLLGAALAASSVVWGLWSLGFLLGLALLVHDRHPGDVGAYGLVIAAYGLGNLVSNLIAASRPVNRPGAWIFGGLSIVGLGFLAMAAAPDVPSLAAAAAFTALGGPLDDLAFLAVLQQSYQGNDVARIFRLRMASIYAGMLLCLAVAPTLYRHVPVPSVLAGAGVFTLLLAGAGLSRHGARRAPHP